MQTSNPTVPTPPSVSGRTHTETLRAAAQAIRDAVPLVQYTPTSAPERLDEISRIQYRDRWRGYYAPHRRVAHALAASFWDRNHYWPWHTGYPENRWARPLHFAHHIWITFRTYLRTGRHCPEVALDGGNVLIYWSECAPFISTWTVPVAEAMADWLDSTANTWDGFAQRDPAALKLAEQILSAVTR